MGGIERTTKEVALALVQMGEGRKSYRRRSFGEFGPFGRSWTLMMRTRETEGLRRYQSGMRMVHCASSVAICERVGAVDEAICEGRVKSADVCRIRLVSNWNWN